MVTKTYGTLQTDQGTQAPSVRDSVAPYSGAVSSSNAAITGVSAEGIQAYDSLRSTMNGLNEQLLRTQATAALVSGDIRAIYDISTALIQVQSDPTLANASHSTRLMFLHSQPGSSEQLRAINYQQIRLDALIANVVEDSGLARLGRAAQQTHTAAERLQVYLKDPALEELKFGLADIKKYALAPTSTADVEKVLEATGRLCANFEKIAAALEKTALRLQGEMPSQTASDYSRILERLGTPQSEALSTALMLEQVGVNKAEFRDAVKLLIRSELPNEQIREALSRPETFKAASLDEIVSNLAAKNSPAEVPQAANVAKEVKVIQLEESQVVPEPSRLARLVEAARDATANAIRVISAPVVVANMAINMIRSASAGSISYAEFSSKVSALGYSPDSLVFKEIAKLLAKWHVIDSTIEIEPTATPVVGQVQGVVGRAEYRLSVHDNSGDSDSESVKARRAAA
jgi:hypothetical protein